MINNDGGNRFHLLFYSNNEGAKTYSALLNRKRRCDSLACYCGCQSRVQGVWGVELWHIFAYTIALNSLRTAPKLKNYSGIKQQVAGASNNSSLKRAVDTCVK